ncbi:unnamed protein product [Spirodela intermedia]|uniref:Uncharacterized protein n=1 Tax=Spirodela intermedia TaxID=51605 RepID=A0A7I8IVZ1_SPIIN|nr:unnamed protein product [Spirodela intermedia]CAA6661979.1 unnamed protein product [Spirodela intermedia]
MRNVVQVEAGGDGNVTSEEDESAATAAAKQHLFCYWWWRSAPEFDDHGRPDERLYPTTVAEVSTLSPRLRVLKEMERLALVSHDSLDDLRHKLLSYHAGDFWVPAGGVRKEEVAIPEVITILLVGPTGSGKSSLVNLMYSVLGRSSLIPFAHTSSGEGTTRCLEEHNVLRSLRNGFCVYDSRGFDYDHTADGLREAAGWVEDGVRHRQPCGGGVDGDTLEENLGDGSPPPRFARRRVNCVVVVANMAEIFRGIKAGDTRPLDATRALFLSPSLQLCGEKPLLVLTHGDELSVEERIEGRVKVCELLGVPEATGAYDVACLNEYGLPVEELDPATAYALAEAVYRALLVADRRHPPRHRAKERLLQALSWLMWSLAAFFAFLSFCFSKLSKPGHWKLKNKSP